MRPRMPLPILAPPRLPIIPPKGSLSALGGSFQPSRAGIHGWGIPFALSGVEGSQERNGWAALLPRRGDRPLTLPGAEGPLTLSQLKVRRGGSKGRTWGGPRFANPSRQPQHHPTPNPPTIPRPREESKAPVPKEPSMSQSWMSAERPTAPLH